MFNNSVYIVSYNTYMKRIDRFQCVRYLQFHFNQSKRTTEVISHFYTLISKESNTFHDSPAKSLDSFFSR